MSRVTRSRSRSPRSRSPRSRSPKPTTSNARGRSRSRSRSPPFLPPSETPQNSKDGKDEKDAKSAKIPTPNPTPTPTPQSAKKEKKAKKRTPLELFKANLKRNGGKIEYITPYKDHEYKDLIGSTILDIIKFDDEHFQECYGLLLETRDKKPTALWFEMDPEGNGSGHGRVDNVGLGPGLFSRVV
jgi:hypothetical protein